MCNVVNRHISYRRDFGKDELSNSDVIVCSCLRHYTNCIIPSSLKIIDIIIRRDL